MAWLFNILKDGTLVDNQLYVAKQGVLTHRRFTTPITLKTRTKGQSIINHPERDESALWQFLSAVNNTHDHHTSALLRFNDQEYEHNTNDNLINIHGTDARNFTLTTGNLIGSIKQGKYFLKLSSRFGDAFLKYMIADADGFLELDKKGGEHHHGGYEWLLAYLWNTKFKRAYRLGLPKAYTSKHERISRVRGNIDTVDYFKNPLSGKYLCTYREHSYDTPANALFAKAYEAIAHYSFCQQTRSIYQAFLHTNQGKKPPKQVLLNTPYFNNPFYKDYNVLIDLSKRILTQQNTDMGSDNTSNAFLFDISMLFEYFIRKLIKRAGWHLLSKFEQRHDIPSGSFSTYRRKLEPDLIFESNNGLYIFDVKYKTYDNRYGVKREDLFQLHTYIGQYGNQATIKGCGFIYPMTERQWQKLEQDNRTTPGLMTDTLHQHGYSLPFHVLFLKIPNADSADFNQQMNAQCQAFIDKLQSNILLET